MLPHCQAAGNSAAGSVERVVSVEVEWGNSTVRNFSPHVTALRYFSAPCHLHSSNWIVIVIRKYHHTSGLDSIHVQSTDVCRWREKVELQNVKFIIIVT